GAVAAGLIHSGSLLHDDVIDRGVERRGRPTANVRYGDRDAVLAGDLLLSLAIARLSDRAPSVVGHAARCLAEMSRAASDEVALRGVVGLDPAQWRAVAAGKTGALFAFAGRAAGTLALDDALAARLGEAGERLGVAFQIADDLADLDGGHGKDRGKDLRERNPNLVVALAVAHDPPLGEALAAAWQGSGGTRGLERLRRTIARGPAPALARARLAAEIALLEQALGPVAHTGAGPAPV